MRVALAILCLYSISTWAQPQLVRVRLAQNLNRLEIEGQGLSVFAEDSAYQAVAFNAVTKMQIERVLIQQQYFWQVALYKNGKTVTRHIYNKPVLVITGKDIHERGRSLPNKLLLGGGARFDLVGVLPLQNYLVGVVSSEMPLSWPAEALRAQAIAARSYTLAAMKEREKKFYHVESSILDQVFNHISQEMDQSPLIQKAKAAVQDTENLILKNKRQKVVKAFYHSDCGGRTSSAKAVWGYGDLQGGAIDQSCPANPKSNWVLQVAESSLMEKIAQFFKLSSAKVIAEIKTTKASDNDRVAQLSVRFADGDSRALSSYDFRRLLGTTDLRSTRFKIEKKASHFEFSGQGYGHGVGLCQWGSKALATQGWSHQRILAHYYPESLLTKQ